MSADSSNGGQQQHATRLEFALLLARAEAYEFQTQYSSREQELLQYITVLNAQWEREKRSNDSLQRALQLVQWDTPTASPGTILCNACCVVVYMCTQQNLTIWVANPALGMCFRYLGVGCKYDV